MSFTPGVLRRQSGMLNVKDAIAAAPLDNWKDARLNLPYANELVDGITDDKSKCVRCKYDYTKKKWYDETGDAVVITLWRK